MSEEKKYTAEQLHEFTVQCFLGAGFSRENAQMVAQSLIEADLRGLNTHGVIRIPMYLKRVKEGVLDPSGQVRIIRDESLVAILDAGNSMGQLASLQAMDLAIGKAKEYGIGIAGVRSSNHFGTAAYYAMQASSRGLIGLACSNTEPLMPAIGGAQAVVGNNPLSVAIPVPDGPDVVMDMAMSAAAIGKIVLAGKRGESIPAGWAADRNGVETTDPAEALDGGTLLPFSGPKGFGLAVVVDVLAGVLTGAGFGKTVYSPFHDFDHPQQVGHFFMVLDPERFLGREIYNNRISTLVRDILESPRAPGVDKLYLPGGIEAQTQERRLREGVPLPPALIEELNSLAGELGVPVRL